MFTVTTLSWKYKISAIWLVVTAWILLFAAVQTSMVYETQESLVGYTKHLNLYLPKTNMCRFSLNQHFMVLNYAVCQLIKFLSWYLLLWKFDRI